MKFGVSAVVVLAMMISVPASAGVVLQRRQTINSGGQQRSIEETVMIQGAKEKRTVEHLDIITDLEARKVTTIDHTSKSYVETEYPPPTAPAGAIAMQLGLVVDYSQQSGERMVAGYKCEYYKGVRTSRVAELVITQCVTTDAPGADAYSAFDRQRIEVLKAEHANVSNHLPPGMPLEVTLSVARAMPATRDTDPEKLRGLQEMIAKQPKTSATTEVLKVAARNLPADTFNVPKGYTRREAKQMIRPPMLNMPPTRERPPAGGGPLRRDAN